MAWSGCRHVQGWTFRLHIFVGRRAEADPLSPAARALNPESVAAGRTRCRAIRREMRDTQHDHRVDSTGFALRTGDPVAVLRRLEAVWPLECAVQRGMQRARTPSRKVVDRANLAGALLQSANRFRGHGSHDLAILPSFFH